MIVRALVEQWPDDFAIYIHELPGVVVAGATLDEALQALADGVEAHLNWLGSHGFDLSLYTDLEIDVAEQLTANPVIEGPLFAADREPASTERIESALQVAALARRDLVDLYRSVSTVRRDASMSKGDWSIAGHLRHIAGAEAWYVEPLVAGQSADLPSDPVEAMRASASYADGVLRSLSDSGRVQVFERSGQEWTANKTTRRMAGHLREHYPWVRDLARR